MNRELIIIIVCMLFVGYFYMQSTETSDTHPIVQIEQPIFIQDKIGDTTKTVVPDSLDR